MPTPSVAYNQGPAGKERYRFILNLLHQPEALSLGFEDPISLWVRIELRRPRWLPYGKSLVINLPINTTDGEMPLPPPIIATIADRTGAKRFVYTERPERPVLR